MDKGGCFLPLLSAQVHRSCTLALNASIGSFLDGESFWFGTLLHKRYILCIISFRCTVLIGQSLTKICPSKTNVKMKTDKLVTDGDIITNGTLFPYGAPWSKVVHTLKGMGFRLGHHLLLSTCQSKCINKTMSYPFQISDPEQERGGEMCSHSVHFKV